MRKSTGTGITYLMTFAVLAGFAVILLMNAAAFLGVVPSRHISPNDVRGIAVEHNNKLYTLNFAQQNELVDIFNRSIPVGKELVDKRKITIDNPPEVEKIIIYRFNAPDLEAIPVAYVSKTSSALQNPDAAKISLVYSVPEWNANGLLEESTNDQLNKLLSSTY
jgi:hypothetical protein